MKRALYLGLITLIVSATALSFASTKEIIEIRNGEEIKTEVVDKEIIGTVAGISHNFIAVEYGADEKAGSLERAFNLDKDVVFSRRKAGELQFGDIVAVVYEETIETKKGQKPEVIKRQVKTVEFRQPAAQVTPETPAAAENKE